MYMLFLTIAIALSTGIGTFAVYDKEQRILASSNEVHADSDIAIRAQMERNIRRQIQIDPSRFPASSPNGLVQIPGDMVQQYLSAGLRMTTDATYFISSNGLVVSKLPDIEENIGGRQFAVAPDDSKEVKVVTQEQNQAGSFLSISMLGKDDH